MNNSNYNLFVYGCFCSGFQHDAFQYMAQYFQLLGAANRKGKAIWQRWLPGGHSGNGRCLHPGVNYTAGKLAHEFSRHHRAAGWLVMYVEEGETASIKGRNTLLTVTGSNTPHGFIGMPDRWMDYPAVASGDVLQYLQEKNKQNPDATGSKKKCHFLRFSFGRARCRLQPWKGKKIVRFWMK